ncbi:uncharacterized protein [Oryza sativa Japonica Group]|uniref:Uncharacterized protein n=1 Tax=Oryza rufipogon TaxID=4529 RepID=A0A0E0R6N4_ORYRU|nr:hypothetical protein DAI22_11g097000 [Oryza sativa Japonica Group]
MEDWIVLSNSDGDSVELHDGSESSFAVVHENAEISDAAQSNYGHVESKITAAKDDIDIECFDEEDGICEENPDDEIFNDQKEIDCEEELDDDDDESLDDDDIDRYCEEDRICEENPDDEIFDDEEEIDHEEDLDDDDDESLDDDDIERYDAEDIICEENPDDEII